MPWQKKKVGRDDRMHFLVRTETEFNTLRREVEKPYSQEEIKVMKRLWKTMHHITEGKRGKIEKE